MKRILERSFVKRGDSSRSVRVNFSRMILVSLARICPEYSKVLKEQSLKYDETTNSKETPAVLHQRGKILSPSKNRAQPASVPDPFPTDTRTKQPSIHRKFFSFSVAYSEHASMVYGSRCMEDQRDNFKAWDPHELQPSGEVGYTPAIILKFQSMHRC